MSGLTNRCSQPLARSHAAAREYPCFVHVGIHKTGTTAIQRFFAANRQQLACEGVYYPRAGRWTPDNRGHHNVAFELTGHPRFERSAGTLADVMREIARVRPARACLSSEVFGYLHKDEHALAVLRDAIAAIGYHPRIIVYLRAQDGYAESLYAEAAKHDMTLPFASYFDDVIRQGVLIRPRSTLRPRRASRFEYGELIEPFSRVFGNEAMTVRGYRDTGRPETLLLDFLNAVGVATRLPTSTVVEGAAYDNRRLTTGGVITRLFANTAALRGDDELAAIGSDLVARYGDDASWPFMPLAPLERERIATRFADDNARIVRQWDVDAETFDVHRNAGADSEPARRARDLFVRAEAIRAARE
jgi:hypothetical protein